MATTQWGKILTLAAIQNKSRWRSLVGSTFFRGLVFFPGSVFFKTTSSTSFAAATSFFVCSNDADVVEFEVCQLEAFFTCHLGLIWASSVQLSLVFCKSILIEEVTLS